jgi:hypothetical protein
MKYRRRIYYSAEQRAEIWDRWQRGESMSSIGRVFHRQSSSVFSVISPTCKTQSNNGPQKRLRIAVVAE